MEKIRVYCDGSAPFNGQPNSRGGYGVVILYGNEEYHIHGKVSGEPTNQICEIWAAIVGLSTVLSNFHLQEHLLLPIEVYSDSAYVVNCINDGWYKKWQRNGWLNNQKKPVANRELWGKLIRLLSFANFQFIKVKGHDNDKYNIIADELAKKGANLNDDEAEIHSSTNRENL